MSKPLGWLAMDQYGNKVALTDTSRTPRQQLMARHYVKSARPIYRDRTSGPPRHVGWIVSGHWYDVFRVFPLKEDA